MCLQNSESQSPSQFLRWLKEPWWMRQSWRRRLDFLWAVKLATCSCTSKPAVLTINSHCIQCCQYSTQSFYSLVFKLLVSISMSVHVFSVPSDWGVLISTLSYSRALVCSIRHKMSTAVSTALQKTTTQWLHFPICCDYHHASFSSWSLLCTVKKGRLGTHTSNLVDNIDNRSVCIHIRGVAKK